MELVCPAGSLPALHVALEAGADAVYTGFRDATNARHFTGLNFSERELERGIAEAHAHGRRVYLAINTYAGASTWPQWQAAVDRAAGLGIDALIAADLGVLDYAAERHSDLRLHLSVQASATNSEALDFYHRHFGIRRAVLPRVLSLQQVAQVAATAPVPVEAFGFGSLCIMAEGRCLLSSYATGQSPNTYGACSPAAHVRWTHSADGLEARLNGHLIDRFAAGERAGYPTLCKGRFRTGDTVSHTFEEPTSLSSLDILEDLRTAGVAAVKVEGRQRSPAYVREVTAVLRAALDAGAGTAEATREEWRRRLGAVSEGSQVTLGAYHRPWG